MVSFPHAYLSRPVSPEVAKDKSRRMRCASWGCRRKRGDKGKTRCYTCISRLFRLKNDDRYAYNNLRDSAKKRRIGFFLTFDDFQEFCAVTGYLELRGKDPTSMTVDRVKTDRPYQVGNIRILTHEDNSSHKYEEFAAKARGRSAQKTHGRA